MTKINHTTVFSKYSKNKPVEKRQALHFLFQFTTGRIRKQFSSVKGGRGAVNTAEIMFQIGNEKSYIYTVVVRNKMCLLVPGTARINAARSTGGIYFEHVTKN